MVDPYVKDLTNMLLALDDPITIRKNFTACTFAMSVIYELTPSQLLTQLDELFPSREDWETTVLPMFNDYEGEDSLDDEEDIGEGEWVS